MPTFEVEFEVFCSCGEGLCQQSSGKTGRKGPKVIVEPCEKCLSKAEEEGYDKGYEQGEKDGTGE